MAPIVGITSGIMQASWSSGTTGGAALLPETYVRAAQRAGAVPVVAPQSPPGSAESLVSGIDALVVSGGGDVDPARYAAVAGEATSVAPAEREYWEFALLDAAIRRDLPILAICRGAQVLAVACGGDLVQHLPDVLGHHDHLPGKDTYGAQSLKVDAASRIGHALGEQPMARCHHHQGFGQLGGALRPVAWAADGIVEGVELDGQRFTVGAQWHPERSGHDPLFAALVAATR